MNGYVQDERYIAIEHMDVRRDCVSLAQRIVSVRRDCVRFAQRIIRCAGVAYISLAQPHQASSSASNTPPTQLLQNRAWVGSYTAS